MEKEIVCSHCGHNWYTKSKLKRVTCPSCSLKTTNKGSAIANNKKGQDNN